MGQKELIAVVNFIMNKASEGDIEVITGALQRRHQEKSHAGLGGMNLGRMSKNVAAQIQQQISIPRDQIRKTVRDMVVKMIRQSVPDIPPEHLEVLLDEWVPEPAARPAGGRELVPVDKVPPDVLLTMVKHYLEYSTRTMSEADLQVLKKRMPNWYEEYWKIFPDTIRELIQFYLNGEMELAHLWDQVKRYVGIASEQTGLV